MISLTSLSLDWSMYPSFETHLDTLLLDLLCDLLVIPWVDYCSFVCAFVNDQIHPVVCLSDLVRDDFHVGSEERFASVRAVALELADEMAYLDVVLKLLRPIALSMDVWL